MELGDGQEQARGNAPAAPAYAAGPATSAPSPPGSVVPASANFSGPLTPGPVGPSAACAGLADTARR